MILEEELKINVGLAGFMGMRAIVSPLTFTPFMVDVDGKLTIKAATRSLDTCALIEANLTPEQWAAYAERLIKFVDYRGAFVSGIIADVLRFTTTQRAAALAAVVSP